ncbi:hypothetical protein [Rhabdochlamydiaceae symbiont of Dictyostelium giganteum]|uniref:hypothetical protein n=1 Tax=Rhabdochlamydiaceae symbiont of Dictyostelium giganteum TaxID=3342349 RepID=UPI00384C09E3
MKLSATKWTVISGFTWLIMGSLLLSKGLKWILLCMMTNKTDGMMGWFMGESRTSHDAGMIMLCIALIAGLIKGRVILAKTVKRVVSRLYQQNALLSFQEAYDKKYFIILGLMMGLGMSFRFIPIPSDIKGFIDVTVGSALIHGAMIYFREAINHVQKPVIKGD